MQEEFCEELRSFCGEQDIYLLELFHDYLCGNADRRYPFIYATAGGEQGFSAALTASYRDRAAALKFLSGRCVPQKIELFYRSECDELEFKTEIMKVCGSFRQRTTVTNVGARPVMLTMLSNQLRLGRYDEIFPFADYELGYCKQNWYNEGQWRFVGFGEIGITDEGGPPPTGSFEINGLSSQTTARYYPNIFLRNKKQNFCGYCELEPLGKWQMSIGLWRDWWKPGGEIILSCGSAEDRGLQFIHRLPPQESYSSSECVYGMVKGDVEEILKRQYAARRFSGTKVLQTPPVVFNDYMNCLWGEPEEEKCLKLARIAKTLGVQVYMLDAGWFGDKGHGWSEDLGAWRTDSNRFEGGILSFIAKIKAEGLIPGIWLELECCGAAVAEKLPKSWFVCRRGEIFGSRSRKFFNFLNPEVKRYLFEKIKPLLDGGIRYIKNDYNDSYYAFDTEDAYCLQENQRAFYQFIEELYCIYPDLIIENCASGAMRSDGNTLKHFSLQSISDQDDYRLYPSIVKGSLMNIIPEQLAVWCMPRPLHCSGKVCSADPLDLIGYNFVSALTGVPYLSGRIDLCTEEENALIAFGIGLYTKWIPFIRKSVPRYPLGIQRLSVRDCDALVMFNESEGRGLLYVWRMEGEEFIDLPISGCQEIEQLFPFKKADAEIYENKITVRLKNNYSAAIFSVAFNKNDGKG